MCELMKAVEAGNETLVEQMLNLELFYDLPSWRQDQGFALLREAVAGGHRQIVELLIGKGARVNNRLGRPTNEPLHFAVGLSGNVEIVQLLIDQGAKVNSHNIKGRTPLHIAVSTNNVSIVEFLLKNQADPNAADVFRLTPLHLVAEYGLDYLTELLLENGAQTEVPLTNGQTPLHVACLKSQSKIVAILVNHGADVNAFSDSGTPLDVAMPLFWDGQGEHVDAIVATLLEAGGKPNAINNDGKTLLYRAVELNRPELVSIILKYADVNYLSFDTKRQSLQTPFQLASQNGYEEVFDLLLSHGADVNMPCNTVLGGGFTPLHLACAYGNYNIVRKLVRAGVDIEEKTLDGKTALHVAVSYVENDIPALLSIVQLLVDNGAKLDSVDEDGCMVLHAAVEKKSLPLVAVLIDFAWKRKKNIKTFVNAKTTVGITPLHLAAAVDCFVVVEFLLKAGAEIDVFCTSSNYGCGSPLHLASRFCHVNTVQVLLKNDANVNALNAKNQSPAHALLEMARYFRYSTDKITESLHLLLQSGTDVNLIDNKGDTILSLGVELRSVEVVKTILNYKPDPANPSNRYSLCKAVTVGTELSDTDFSQCSFNHRNDALKENRNIIKSLLNYGLSFNATDLENSQVVHHAIQKGYINVVQHFLERGYNCNTLSSLGTPLHSAVKMLQVDIFKYLLSLGADVNAKDQNGRPVIFYVSKKLHDLNTSRIDIEDFFKSSIIARELLINGVELCDEPDFLINVIRIGDFDLVKLALNGGANVNVFDDNGSAPLHAAILIGDDRLVKILLERGANVEAKTKNLNTPLLVAIAGKHEDIADILIDEGAAVNVKDSKLHTPLHYAAMWGFTSIIEKLLDKGAELDAKNHENLTAVFLAAEYRHYDCVLTLLRHGADPNVKTDDRGTILHLIAETGDENIVENLLYYGADPLSVRYGNMTPFDCSLKKGNLKVVRFFTDLNLVPADACCTLRASTFSCRKNDGNEDIPTFFFLELVAKSSLGQFGSCGCAEWYQTQVIPSLDAHKELQVLRNKPLSAGYHFVDLILKSKKHLVSLCRNETVSQDLDEFNFEAEFPVFGRLLAYKWKAALTRKIMLAHGVSSFNLIVVRSLLSHVESPNSLNSPNSSVGWLFNYLKIKEKSKVSLMECLVKIDYLLPEPLVEKIVNHLSNYDIRNLSEALDA